MARTVLVADDSPTHQRKAKGILTGEGLEVVTVSNGVAAIKKLPTVKPLLVLADVSMPGKDGYEVCEFVKNSPGLAHVPVLLIVSDMEPCDEARAARVGADGTIKKPFAQEELVSAVTKFLARAEAAAPRPQPPAPVMAPPPPAMVTEPVDVEPEISTKLEGPELGALSEAAAFFEPALEQAPAVVLEAVVPAGEPMMEVPGAPLPEAAPPVVEPTLEMAVAPEPAAEPSPEAVAAPVEEPPAEMAPALEEAPIPAEPVLVEEEVAPFAPPPAPEEEATMVFRAPGEIAEPVLSDELTPAPTVAEAPAEAVPEAPPPEVSPVAVTTLESFSLSEASAGQVRFAAPEVEAVPEAEAVAAAPAPAPEVAAAPAPVAAIDANLIYAIVHRVVLKMAPAALPPQVIEDMVRQLAEEILAELSEAPSESQ